MAKQYTNQIATINRMNSVMNMMLRKSITLKDVIGELDVGKRAAHFAVHSLLDMGKIKLADHQWDRRFKHYVLVPGALPVPVPEVRFSRRRKPHEEPKKRGPKPGSRGNGNPGVGEQRVKSVSAVQIGLMRDPLVAALFGGSTC